MAQSEDVIGSDDSDSPALDPMHARFVALRIEGASMGDAAKDMDRSERTLFRWLKRADVKAALRENLTATLGQARQVLTGSSVMAAQTIANIAYDPDTAADPVRLTAARAVLEFAVNLAQVEDLSERIDQIEAQLLASRGFPVCDDGSQA